MEVHAARPQQRRVQNLWEVGGEDEDPLVPAGRPQPVCKVQHASWSPQKLVSSILRSACTGR